MQCNYVRRNTRINLARACMLHQEIRAKEHANGEREATAALSRCGVSARDNCRARAGVLRDRPKLPAETRQTNIRALPSKPCV